MEYIHAGRHFLGTLTLGRDSFVFLEDRETRFKEAYDFRISPASISHLSWGHWAGITDVPASEVASDSQRPGNVVVTIHFKQKISVGTKIDVRVDIPTTMMLIRYVAQMRSR